MNGNKEFPVSVLTCTLPQTILRFVRAAHFGLRTFLGVIMKKVFLLSVILAAGISSVSFAGGKPDSVPANITPAEASDGMAAAAEGRARAAEALASE